MTKRKKIITWVVAVLIMVVILGVYFYRGRGPQVEYIMATVEMGELIQTVTATGSVKSPTEINLEFETLGKIAALNVKAGQKVEAGEILAQLDISNFEIEVVKAEAALALAQANLDQRLAGSSQEEIEVAQTEVKKAQASLNKAKTDLNNAKVDLENVKINNKEDIKVAELSVEAAKDEQDNAKNDLDNTKATYNQAVNDAYDDAQTTTKGNIVIMSQTMTDMDDILGVDNETVNDAFENNLGALGSVSQAEAESAYHEASISQDKADFLVNNLTANSTEAEIEEVMEIVKKSLSLVTKALEKTKILLDNTTTSSSLSQAQLSTYKTTIDTDRTSINTALSSLETNEQTINTAKLTENSKIDTAEAAYKTAQNNYDQAKQNLSQVEAGTASNSAAAEANVSSAELQVNIQEEALLQAEANLALKKATPRSVDVAPLRAQVEEAQALLSLAREKLAKAFIRAPIEGIITAVNFQKGEQTSTTEPVISMIGLGDFEVEVDISEADIAKINLGDPVEITLDAFGVDKIFLGEVIFIDPAETVIQDVIYYQLKVSFLDQGDLVKAGMTVDVTIETNKKINIFIIPERAVSSNGQKVVKILNDGVPEERVVTTGLRGDGGMIEVMSGLVEGEEVVTYVKEKN